MQLFSSTVAAPPMTRDAAVQFPAAVARPAAPASTARAPAALQAELQALAVGARTRDPTEAPRRPAPVHTRNGAAVICIGMFSTVVAVPNRAPRVVSVSARARADARALAVVAAAAASPAAAAPALAPRLPALVAMPAPPSTSEGMVRSSRRADTGLSA